MQRIHIIGRKNSGKTTLVVELVAHYQSRGLRVATIKHTHHRHELDVPGKDSFRHRQAGAAAVGILSPGMNAVFWPAEPMTTADSHLDRYDAFAALFADCDLVLVEGDTRTSATKLEVWREETGQTPLAHELPAIHAVITDSTAPMPVAVWPRRDLADLADRILALARAS